MILYFKGGSVLDELECVLALALGKCSYPMVMEISFARPSEARSKEADLTFRMDSRADHELAIELLKCYGQGKQVLEAVLRDAVPAPVGEETQDLSGFFAELRKRFPGKTGAEMAQTLGISNGQFSRLKNGRTKLSRPMASSFILRLDLDPSDELHRALTVLACA